VFSNDGEDPSQIAARKMDWELFLSGLSDREKAVIENMVAGRNMTEIAKSFRLHSSRVHQIKNQLVGKILEFMGSDILVEVRRSPKWRNNLNASRERLASRSERRN
jgi:FixJ family two-component response regulator